MNFLDEKIPNEFLRRLQGKKKMENSKNFRLNHDSEIYPVKWRVFESVKIRRTLELN